MLLNGPVFLTS